MEIRKEIEQKRKEIMEQLTNDIKASIKKLDECETEEQRKEVEEKIDQDRAKLNSLVKEEQ